MTEFAVKFGVIYVITTGQNSLYVGSTKNFKKRVIEHNYCLKCPSRSGHNRKLYKTIRENNNEYKIYKLYDFPFENIKELHQEEERVRKILRADLNMLSCYNTPEENQKMREKIQKFHNDKRKFKRLMNIVFNELINNF